MTLCDVVTGRIMIGECVHFIITDNCNSLFVIGAFRVRLWSASFLEVMSRAEALLMFFDN
jgi:hypothetical protein